MIKCHCSGEHRIKSPSNGDNITKSPSSGERRSDAVPDALKQKTPNFWSALANHVTTPVLPFPHLTSAERRGTTAVCSEIQPNLENSQ